MFIRTFWLEKIHTLLKKRSVLWLAGVRRAGKTTLCRMLEDSSYHDCELPRVRRMLEDPELFFSRQDKPLVVLDEIHRLLNPSEVLKIAADHFPHVKVVATGSSTLAARRKFRDALTGRKHMLWLVPSILQDLRDFGLTDLDRRMLFGGLPPFLLEGKFDDGAFREWIESFWARDLQELFAVERKAAFLKLMEMIFRQSGSLFEATAFAGPCEISRQTVQNYLQILEITLVVVALRPFSGASPVELRAQPKVYAFDNGFVGYLKDIASLRPDDRGPMLEHLVLNELLAHFGRDEVYYWRDKQKHEVDFVVKAGRGRAPLAIECKVASTRFDPSGLAAFRRRHPSGPNLVACLDLAEPLSSRVGGLDVRFVPFDRFDKELGPWIRS